MKVRGLSPAEKTSRRDTNPMSRSRQASDLISSIRFILISTLWHISEVFTKSFSDIIASSQSGFPSLYITVLLMTS
jgi:hypothetical protein